MDVVKIPSLISLAVIFGILFIAGVSSWYAARQERPGEV